MSAWIKIISQPLGLAGFSLFLLFQLVRQILKEPKLANETRRLILLAGYLTGIAVIAGVGVSYLPAVEALTRPQMTTKEAAIAVRGDKQPAGAAKVVNSPNSAAVAGSNNTVTVQK